MLVKYVVQIDTIAFNRDKIYDVLSVEKDWYRIMTELDEDYLFPPESFELLIYYYTGFGIIRKKVS